MIFKESHSGRMGDNESAVVKLIDSTDSNGNFLSMLIPKLAPLLEAKSPDLVSEWCTEGIILPLLLLLSSVTECSTCLVKVRVT